MAGGASTFSFPIGPRRARGRQEIGFEPVSLATSLKGKLEPAVSADPTFALGHRNHWQDRNAALHAKRLLEERLVEYRKRLIIVGRQEGRADVEHKRSSRTPMGALALSYEQSKYPELGRAP